MKYAKIALLAGFLSLLPSLPAAAAQEDRKQPVEIYAENSSLDANTGISRLNGNVSLSQGSLKIKADRGVVHAADGTVSRVEFSGSPASISQQVDESGPMNAQAREIEYDAGNSAIIFRGRVNIDHPQGNIKGEYVRYDLINESFEGQGGDQGGRIHFTLDPPVPQEDGDPESKRNGESGEDSEADADH